MVFHVYSLAFNAAAQSIEIELGFQQVLNTESGTRYGVAVEDLTPPPPI